MARVPRPLRPLRHRRPRLLPAHAQRGGGAAVGRRGHRRLPRRARRRARFLLLCGRSACLLSGRRLPAHLGHPARLKPRGRSRRRHAWRRADGGVRGRRPRAALCPGVRVRRRLGPVQRAAQARHRGGRATLAAALARRRQAGRQAGRQALVPLVPLDALAALTASPAHVRHAGRGPNPNPNANPNPRF